MVSGSVSGCQSHSDFIKLCCYRIFTFRRYILRTINLLGHRLVGQIQNPRIDGKDPIGNSQLFCLKYTGLQFKIIDNPPRNVHKIQLYLYSSVKPGTTLHTNKLSHMITYRKVVNSNTSRLEAHAGFFRLLRKGIFDPYVL